VQRALDLLRAADAEISAVGHNALDHPSGTAIPMWGPLGPIYTNWGDRSWDSVRTC
jgi:hypothetical protein